MYNDIHDHLSVIIVNFYYLSVFDIVNFYYLSVFDIVNFYYLSVFDIVNFYYLSVFDIVNTCVRYSEYLPSTL